MAGSQESHAKAGDWISFYQNGHIVISQIAYVRKSEQSPYHVEYLTDAGVTVSFLEKRSREVDDGE